MMEEDNEIIITQDRRIGRGYFVKFSKGIFAEEYCYTLWGAKRKAKKLLKRGHEEKEVCRIKYNGGKK